MIMILGVNFKGDENEDLKRTQYASYSANVYLIINSAKYAFILADEITQSNSPIATRLRRIEHIDHHDLQFAHDILAAVFRFKFQDGKQLQLGETPQTQMHRYSVSWRSWLIDELAKLKTQAEFVRLVAEIIAEPNELKKASFKGKLKDLLLYYYDDPEWIKKKEY